MNLLNCIYCNAPHLYISYHDNITIIECQLCCKTTEYYHINGHYIQKFKIKSPEIVVEHTGFQCKNCKQYMVKEHTFAHFIFCNKLNNEYNDYLTEMK